MRSMRIFLLGNNSLLLNLISRFLPQLGPVQVVGTATDGRLALPAIRRLQPDGVVVDLGTPGLTGLETITLLRAAHPAVALVVTSLLQAPGYRQSAFAAGADAFVSQAKLATELLPAIRDSIDQKNRVTAMVPGDERRRHLGREKNERAGPH